MPFANSFGRFGHIKQKTNQHTIERVKGDLV